MKRVYFTAVAAALLVSAAARASDPVGVYALIDKVVLEPNEQTPERIQLWGAFRLAEGGSQYAAPVRGYLYFAIVPGQEKQCRAEWNDLKKIAGTGQCVAFGNRGAKLSTVRKPKQRVPSAGPVEPQRVARLLADLDSDQFTVREQATKELEKLGEAVEPALREALNGKLSAEARRRVQQVLKIESPDVYPVGSGLYNIRTEDADYSPVREIITLPAPLTPTEGDLVEAGKVTLTTRNILGPRRKNARYVFEIENASGQKETSDPVTAGEKETRWSPRMELKAGETYTWRVWAVDGTWKGPVSSTAFQGKSVR
jgi:hypothetical protein